jgi:hypothetical protein
MSEVEGNLLYPFSLFFSKVCPKQFAYLCSFNVYLYKRGRNNASRAFPLPEIRQSKQRRAAMKFQRHNAIRDLVASVPVSNQDELRRKLRRRGFEVTSCASPRAPEAMRCPEATAMAP